MTDFDKWLDEFEGYATRKERLLETFPDAPAKDLFIWLKASWAQGFISGSGFVSGQGSASPATPTVGSSPPPRK